MSSRCAEVFSDIKALAWSVSGLSSYSGVYEKLHDFSADTKRTASDLVCMKPSGCYSIKIGNLLFFFFSSCSFVLFYLSFLVRNWILKAFGILHNFSIKYSNDWFDLFSVSNSYIVCIADVNWTYHIVKRYVWN